MKVPLWGATAWLTAAMVGVAHELGHFVVGLGLGWSPGLHFANGGSVEYGTRPEVPAASQELFALAGGPLATLGLAAAVAWSLPRRSRSVPLIVAGLFNAVFRLSVLMDGRGSDEFKMSALVGVPYAFQALAVAASVGLCLLILRRQSLVRFRAWMVALIPLIFVVFAACYVTSLNAMAAVFG